MYPQNMTVIQLQKAANGWIVILPMQYDEPPVVDFTSPEQIKKIARLYKEEYQKDNLLEDLGVYDTPQTMIQVPEQKEKNNVFIFSSYDQAAAFVKERYDS